jgi:ribulose kinase
MQPPQEPLSSLHSKLATSLALKVKIAVVAVVVDGGAVMIAVLGGEVSRGSGSMGVGAGDGVEVGAEVGVGLGSWR